MPVIYEKTTGVLKTGDLQITQPTGTLIFEMSKRPNDLTNEKISIWIERAGASNVYLATKISLKDFLYSCLCNDKGKVFNPFGEENIIVANIGLEAAINIKDGEKMKVSLEGLIATDTYKISYVPHFESTNSYLSFEYKAIVEGYKDQTIDVSECDVAVIGMTTTLNEIGITMHGSDEKRFTPRELQILQLEDTPMVGFTVDNQVEQLDKNVIILPTQGISKLRFYKDSMGIIPITLMKRDELIPATSKAGYPLKLR